MVYCRAMTEWSDWYRREDPTGWVLPAILRRRAEEHPDRDFLRVSEGPWLGYGEVNARANRVANALIARGLVPGEAVSTLLPNVEENFATWFGIQKAGGVQCPVNLAYRGTFLSWVLNLPRSRFLVIDQAYLGRLEQIADELVPEPRGGVVHRAARARGPTRQSAGSPSRRCSMPATASPASR